MILSLLVSLSTVVSSVDSSATRDSVKPTERYTIHFQQTVIVQGHPAFHAGYTGANSLVPTQETRTSITSTIFSGARLWSGSAIYFDPELSGGQGLSGTTGVAGFPNGEIYRVGNPTPILTIARLYLQQAIGFGNERERVDDGLNQISTDLPVSRLTISLGKFSVVDFFDGNSYSHDARSQFLNWSLMDNGAWDYPADTRGYTIGGTMEYHTSDWAIRVAEVAIPTTANGPELVFNSNSHAEAIELEKTYSIGERTGVLRGIYFHNVANMGSYRETLNTPRDSMDITRSRAEGRVKYGFGIDLEQQISSSAGAFLRAGWNDGATETWAFTEIDRTLSLGVLFSGTAWKRPYDNLGIAAVINGLSDDHREYLARGGLGFIIGDGALSYSPEEIAEFFYRLAITDKFSLSADLQGVMHPAYNADRGPVPLYGLRAHFEF